ncbi:hypothetical protein Tco_1429294 [Tanacetum coccineum]
MFTPVFLVAIVAYQEQIYSVGSTFFTTIDQDEQTTKFSPTNQEIQSQVTHQDSAHPFESPLAGTQMSLEVSQAYGQAHVNRVAIRKPAPYDHHSKNPSRVMLKGKAVLSDDKAAINF